jgi:prepilin-type N-terminal cleavage/methylation domain-containing protein
MTSVQTNMRGQAGFTLVELAIVMIIIGLLIAGVLKGQALIGNAKVTAQVAQFKSIDAAVSTFKDMYAALPGDILTPTTRLPNCGAAPCNIAGGGDGNIGPVGGGTLTFGAVPTTEQSNFFVHMSAADLITGINPALLLTFGGQYPAAKLNGGITPGTLAGGVVPNNGLSIPAASVMGGLYLLLDNVANAAAPATGDVTANEAARIDTKVDDGVPSSGSVFPGGAGNCVVGAAPNATYNESVQGQNCNLFVRIQG